MITAILLSFLAILAIFLIGIAWGANARKRARQSGTTNSATTDSPKIGRASGPD